jgi:hypothetical protein
VEVEALGKGGSEQGARALTSHALCYGALSSTTISLGGSTSSRNPRWSRGVSYVEWLAGLRRK